MSGSGLPPEIAALRTGVALDRSDTTRVIALRGEHARAALLHLLPSRLYLRDAQVRESLLLREDGRPIADVLACADDEDYFLLVEGLSREQLVEHVEASLPDGVRPEVEELSSAYEVISLAGPWAWELTAEVLGPDMIALPYLNFFRIDQGFCVRAGKTGEFGYDLVVRRDTADALVEQLSRAGEAWGLRAVTPETLSICRFENWFFDPRHVPDGVTPVELQLQWRLDMSRRWQGREAIDARLSDGTTRRLTCMLAEREVAAGDAVQLGDEVIGEVTRAERSPLLGAFVVAALVDVGWAHGGIDAFEVAHAGARVPVRTTAPPLVNNQSLYVDPRRHSFREVDEVAFEPLTRGARTGA